jgi:type III secretion protein Q
LPVLIEWRLGSSVITTALLKKVCPGDVLLVQTVCNELTAGGGMIANYIKTEEGFMLDEQQMIDEDTFSPTEEEQIDLDKEILSPRHKIKVTLSFVLQQEKVPLEMLDSLYRGKIITCRSDAEHNVIINVNGMSIAKGELVWVEDRMGVEIKEIDQGMVYGTSQ